MKLKANHKCFKKELKYNEIITIVEDLDKLENKILTQCSKARFLNPY